MEKLAESARILRKNIFETSNLGGKNVEETTKGVALIQNLASYVIKESALIIYDDFI